MCQSCGAVVYFRMGGFGGWSVSGGTQSIISSLCRPDHEGHMHIGRDTNHLVMLDGKDGQPATLIGCTTDGDDETLAGTGREALGKRVAFLSAGIYLTCS